jgi:integrase/recombinase XerD
MKHNNEKEFTCNKKRLPRVMSKDELRKFLAYVDDIRMNIVVFFGVFLGLRIGEIIRLKWEDIDLKRKEIRILDAKNTKRFKSGYGKDRIVPITKFLINFILKLRELYPNEIYVIASHGNKEREGNTNVHTKNLIRNFQCKFNDYAKKANLLKVDYYQKNGSPRYNYHTHTLRHICGCNLRKAKVSIEDIRDFLGHVKVEDTMIYAELTKEDLRNGIEKCFVLPQNYEKNIPEQNVMNNEIINLIRLNTTLLKEYIQKKQEDNINVHLPQ